MYDGLEKYIIQEEQTKPPTSSGWNIRPKLPNISISKEPTENIQKGETLKVIGQTFWLPH